MTTFVNKKIGGDCPVTFWTFAFRCPKFLLAIVC